MLRTFSWAEFDECNEEGPRNSAIARKYNTTDITNQIGIFLFKQFSSVKNLLPMNYEAFVQEEFISFELRKQYYQVAKFSTS